MYHRSDVKLSQSPSKPTHVNVEKPSHALFICFLANLIMRNYGYVCSDGWIWQVCVKIVSIEKCNLHHKPIHNFFLPDFSTFSPSTPPFFDAFSSRNDCWNFWLTTVPRRQRTKQAPNTILLSWDIASTCRHKRAPHVMMFMGTLNNL